MKNDIYIDSLETIPFEVTTTTLPTPTTTSTTTTTLPAREAAFFEGFESPLGAEWTNHEVQLWTTAGQPSAFVDGATLARFNAQDSLRLSLSLCGYRDIKVQWNRMTKNRQTGRYLDLSWWDGAVWRLLERINGNTLVWEAKVFSLPASANDNPAFQLKIESINTTTAGLGFVDKISITGTPGALR
ncbi:MAG: hypothetical protein HY899_07350 [Deltaproteobacteria bacterium]|nr:hypothetical protein [Deltaproteobacteria bacterium]